MRTNTILILLLAVFLIAVPTACSKKTTQPSIVSTPTFNPPGGNYNVPKEVTITCETPDATIYYTLDGSDPSKSTTVYTTPILITEPHTLKAKATKSGWSDSAIASATYNIATVAGFVYVPGGTFTMGRASGPGINDELPTHEVTLNPFYIGKYEVTQGEWEAVMGSNPAHNYGVGDTHPVYYVNWYDAIKYCNLRSIAEGLVPAYTIAESINPAEWGNQGASWNAALCNWTANGYRLPTEAEWEYAARGTTNTPDYVYAGSDVLAEVGWYSGNSDNSTWPVGSKNPNGIGIHDMCGSVWEWCWNWYGTYSDSPQTNPTGPETGTNRVRRGGSWSNGASDCRLAVRDAYHQSYAINNGGLRLCRSIDSRG